MSKLKWPRLDGKIGAPPVLDPIVFDVAVGLELADLVRPRSQRDIERRFVERPGRVIGLREDRQRRDIERHVARALFGKGDDQRRVVERFGLHHVAHLRDDERMALLLQCRERERGVMRGQLRAVVKARFRPQRKAVGQLVRRNLHGFRDLAVHRVRLVARPRHQRRKGQFHAARAFAFQDEGVERVERIEGLVVEARRRDGRKQPALRRGHVHIVEMMEVGRVFQVAEHRQAVRLGAGLGGGGRREVGPRSARRGRDPARAGD